MSNNSRIRLCRIQGAVNREKIKIRGASLMLCTGVYHIIQINN